MSGAEEPIAERLEDVELSEEQKEWIKDHLGEEPSEISGKQRQYISENWNKVVNPEEYHASFPPREPTFEEMEADVLVADDLKKSIERREQLFMSIMKISEPEWLVEGFAVRQGITVFYGDAGEGKTSLMLQLIGSAFESRRLLSFQVRLANPLLIEQDENPELLRSHVERMIPVYPSLRLLEVPREPVLWDNQKGDFANTLLEDYIRYSAANIVIIDSLTSLGIDDINHPKCSIIFDKFRLLAREWGCAFIVLHHPNKSGNIMGNKLIRAKAECVIQLQKGKVLFEKLRAKMPSSLVIEVGKVPYLEVKQDTNTLVFNIDRTTYIREQFLEGKSRAEIIDITRALYGGSKDAIGKAVDREKATLKEEGKL